MALVEQAFGDDAENRILRFLLEQDPPNCRSDADRWLGLFGWCEEWRARRLLWEKSVCVGGVSGWNLEMSVCRLRLPGEGEDWIEYLYRATLSVVVDRMGPSEKNRVAAHGQTLDNFSSRLWFSDYRVDPGFAGLTKEQWLEEVTGLLERSWELYRRFPGSSASGQRELARDYPKFDAALEYLSRSVGDCEVARMNRHGGDETVWYFARTRDCFYLMWLSDRA